MCRREANYTISLHTRHALIVRSYEGEILFEGNASSQTLPAPEYLSILVGTVFGT